MENGLKQLGIPFVRAAVGDRYVMEQLLAKGWKIGAYAAHPLTPPR